MKTIALLLFISLSANAQNNCSFFKTGIFKYADAKLADWEIERNDSIQTEFNSKTGKKIVGIVKWKSECEYVLVYKSISAAEKNDDRLIGKKVHVTITETSDKKFKSFSSLGKKNIEAEMVKIY